MRCKSCRRLDAVVEFNGNGFCDSCQFRRVKLELALAAGYDKACVHCGHTDTLMPNIIRDNSGGVMAALVGSDMDFCTNCENPWEGSSIDCEHCGTHELWVAMNAAADVGDKEERDRLWDALVAVGDALDTAAGLVEEIADGDM